MIMALLAAYLTRKPPLVQAVVFGLCVGLFVAAAADANEREPRIGTTAVLVLVVGLVAGGGFYAGLRAQRRRASGSETAPAGLLIAYAAVWVLSLLAAIRALFGEGGLKVAVLAIVPIVLLAPTAMLGIRLVLGRSSPDPNPSDVENAPRS